MKDFVKQSAFAKLAAMEKAEGRSVSPGVLKPEKPEAMKGAPRIGQKAASGGGGSLGAPGSVKPGNHLVSQGQFVKKVPPRASNEDSDSEDWVEDFESMYGDVTRLRSKRDTEARLKAGKPAAKGTPSAAAGRHSG